MIEGHPCPPATQCWHGVKGCTYRQEEHLLAKGVVDSAAFYNVVATVRRHSNGEVEVLDIENRDLDRALPFCEECGGVYLHERRCSAYDPANIITTPAGWCSPHE